MRAFPARRFVAFALSSLLAVAAHAQPAPAPVAPVRNVQDQFHGTTVNDPYRYLEDLKDPAVQAWLQAQGAVARSTLDRIEGRDALLKRIAAIDAGLGDRRSDFQRAAGGRIFYMLRERTARQQKLVTRASPDGPERVLADPEVPAQRTGVPHAINWYVPSRDGRYVAYGLSEGGAEDETMHVVDVRTGRTVGEPIPHVPEEGVSWFPDSRTIAFNQLRTLKPGEPVEDTYLDSTVRRLRVGAPVASAQPVFGPLASPGLGLARLDNGRLVFAPGSPWVIAATTDTTQKEGSVFVARIADLGRRPIPWRPLARFDDHWVAIELAGDHVYYLTKVDAPRFQVMRRDLRSAAGPAVPVARPPSDGLIEAFTLVGRDVVTSVRQGASIGVRRHAPGDVDGRPVVLPFAGAARVAEDVSRTHRDLLVTASGYTQPNQVFLVDGRGVRAWPALGMQVPAGLPDIEVREVQVPSHDGVLVPMTILHRKGLRRDGTNPTLLSGYGSYGYSETAGFRSHQAAWLESGGVLAVANVRGSGVLGDPWRMAGTKLQKPNTWKDAIACGQYLVQQGYASPATLGITGGSAGGIFAGRAITDAPQLFAAAVIHVGMLDAVRAENSANGVTNISEFGSVNDPDGFRGLLEMSTYHQIRDGTAYPGVLLVHGLNDPRVDPWNSAKAAARFQAANPKGRPVLLRLDAQNGHGVGQTATQAQATSADAYSFLLWQMGKRKLQD